MHCPVADLSGDCQSDSRFNSHSVVPLWSSGAIVGHLSDTRHAISNDPIKIIYRVPSRYPKAVGERDSSLINRIRIRQPILCS